MRYQSTTGLEADQIDELVCRVHEVLSGRSSQSGRPARLGLYRQVVLVLVLLRQNMTQTVAGDMFGVSQPTVSRIYRALLPIIEQVIRLHQPPVPEVFANRVVLVDGTDIPTGNRAEGRENYSGKRHRQGLVVQVGADLSGMLLAVSDPVRGSCHDRRAVAETGWEEALAGIDWFADPAYIGTTAITPIKRAPGKDLTDDRKANNKVISGYRSAVERCIAHLKNWKILATGYRGHLVELPNVIRVVVKLEFYRLGW
jgi:hypothetical protein